MCVIVYLCPFCFCLSSHYSYRIDLGGTFVCVYVYDFLVVCIAVAHHRHACLGVCFAIARHWNSSISLISSRRMGVCVYKKGPGMFPHLFQYHQRPKTSVFADFWKTRAGWTDGWTDGWTNRQTEPLIEMRATATGKAQMKRHHRRNRVFATMSLALKNVGGKGREI